MTNDNQKEKLWERIARLPAGKFRKMFKERKCKIRLVLSTEEETGKPENFLFYCPDKENPEKNVYYSAEKKITEVWEKAEGLHYMDKQKRGNIKKTKKEFFVISKYLYPDPEKGIRHLEGLITAVKKMPITIESAEITKGV